MENYKEGDMKFNDSNNQRKNIIQESHLAASEPLKEGQPIFSHIEFDLCGWCNRDCVFCPRSDPDYPAEKKTFDVDMYEKTMHDLASVRYAGRLSYSGLSEPYLHKEIYKLIQITKNILPNCVLEIVSNGDVLNSSRMRKSYDSGLDKLLISMYDGPEQIDYFNNMRLEEGLPEEWLILRKRFLSEDENFGINLTNRGGLVKNLEHLGVKSKPETMRHQCYYMHYRMMIDYQWRNTQKSDFENLYNERLSDEIPLIHKSKSKADLVL